MSRPLNSTLLRRTDIPTFYDKTDKELDDMACAFVFEKELAYNTPVKMEQFWAIVREITRRHYLWFYSGETNHEASALQVFKERS